MSSSIEHRLVQIVWEGPLKTPDVFVRTTPTDKGLYVIYGHHTVFGPGSLLYVGMTNDQTFGDRFKQHQERWLRYESDVEIRLGRVQPEAMDLLRDVEALTIWWHSPPYNSKNIWQYQGPPLRVQNREARGRLHPEYSSHWKPEKTPPEGEG